MNPHARRYLLTLPVMTAGACLIAIGFNLFLIPYQLLSGGVSGISMMIGYITGGDIGWLYLILNLPLLLWGWFAVGRRFICWSVYSVLASTFFLQVIPINDIADDLLLGAVFGGVIIGFGGGLTLRYGGSSGGFDIVASIVTRKRDLPIGMIIFLLNGVVIAALVLFTKNWNSALYSLIAIFSAGKVVDLIHVRHVKLTAFIITTKTDELLARLLKHPRGITIVKTRGAYSSSERDMLMTVRTKYELAELCKTITSIDPHAFINIVETVGVIGDFSKPKD
ncbi:YitT family protein [Paenibacillus arenilitoris]|uniref:YitT family protein n=1 Tax=Paenibacillus arenilitoris TaxID=2772299 RepID=A0A927CRG2_9BACL|nr:YitT family protein [Paenibacillus arenilitoris]MBD2872789.1 YitT family protein [Paenibacillus arenilitoris]